MRRWFSVLLFTLLAAALGLCNLRAGYHNPDNGRFWTMDSFEGFGSDPASLHKYTYCGNNAVNAWDPSGNTSFAELSISQKIGLTSATINIWSAAGHLREGKIGEAGVDVLFAMLGVGGAILPPGGLALAGGLESGIGAGLSQALIGFSAGKAVINIADLIRMMMAAYRTTGGGGTYSGSDTGDDSQYDDPGKKPNSNDIGRAREEQAEKELRAKYPNAQILTGAMLGPVLAHLPLLATGPAGMMTLFLFSATTTAGAVLDWNAGYGDLAAAQMLMLIAPFMLSPRETVMSYEDVYESGINWNLVGCSTLNQQRRIFGVSRQKNIAWAEIEVAGVPADRVVGVSGEFSPEGTAPVPTERVFETFEVGHPRALDSEVKVLESLAKQLKANSRGMIRIFSERPFCPSCRSVILQFKARFPKIKIETVDGIESGSTGG